MTIVLAALLGLLAAAEVEVRPSDLETRKDLVNQKIVVDGRVKGTFQFRKNKGFDEFRLEKSPVIFRLPPALAFKAPPRAPAVRATGVLKQEGDHRIVDVTNLQIQPTDLERVNLALRALRDDDATNREAWSGWAARRAAEYHDEPLAALAAEAAAAAIAIEARRPDADRLALAEKARSRHVAEPFPSALAHAGFRALLETVKTPAEAQALGKRIAAFFPQANEPVPNTNLAAALPAYQAQPESFYKEAAPDLRPALDRRLYTDAKARELLLSAREKPKESIFTVTAAQHELPDRPDVQEQLRGMALTTADVSTLRQSEVLEYAKIYRDQGKPDDAKRLIRRWLDDQRSRLLTPTDAEGRVTLAEAYETMLGDRASAEALLREAWKIDPLSKTTADLFRRLGYRRVDDDWEAAAPAGSKGSSPSPDGRPIRDPTGDPLKGLTRKDVQNLQGRPQRIARSVTQGQYREQWIYQSNRKTQYINFLQRPDMPDAIVVSHQTLD